MQTSSQTRIRSCDLPREFSAQIDRHLMSFSTPLILDGTLAGSGTFIKCGNLYGILTAYHVAHNPKDRSRAFDFSINSKQHLGLSLVNNRPHTFSIPMRLVSCLDIGIPRHECSGPDLSVIILPECDGRSIEARKSFIDVSIKRKERIASCLALFTEGGTCCAVGFPKHYEESLEPSSGAKRSTYLPSLTLYTIVNKVSKKAGFDFLDLDVVPSRLAGAVNPPPSYKGMSGGGVWVLHLSRDERTNTYSINAPATALAGVVFYETFDGNKPKDLRCHGPKSVYEKVYERLSRWKRTVV